MTVTGSVVQTVGLGFTATATGGASAFVGETITDKVNNKDYSLQVFTDGSGPLPDTVSSSVTLNPATGSLHVIKSIDVAANGMGRRRSRSSIIRLRSRAAGSSQAFRNRRHLPSCRWGLQGWHCGGGMHGEV